MNSICCRVTTCLAVLICGMVDAAERLEDDLVEFPEVRKVRFPDGFRIVDRAKVGAKVVKRIGEATEANVKAVVRTGDGDFYISDWSWEQRKKGRSFHFMYGRVAAELPDSTPPPVGGGKRLQSEKQALLIGIDEYKAVGQLANPVRDVEVVGRALEEGGFEVSRSLNPTLDGVRQALGKFLQEAPSSRLSLLYFAGHGVEIDGENYLLPADFSAQTPGEFADRGISVSGLLGEISEAGIDPLVLVLDCCRNNPFADDASITNAGKTGLADIDGKRIGRGILVAYSAPPGIEASDGEPGENSPFVLRLIDELQPGRSAIRTFLDLAYDQKGDQNPWVRFNSLQEGKGMSRITMVPLIGDAKPLKSKNVDALERLRNVLFEELREVYRNEANERFLVFESFKKQTAFLDGIAEHYLGTDYFGPGGAASYFGKEWGVIASGFEQQQRIESANRGEKLDEGVWLTNRASHFLSDLMTGVTEEMIAQLGSALVPRDKFPVWLEKNRIGEYWRGVKTNY